jgi:putative inorganic carbon (HCO3(-)) transporter
MASVTQTYARVAKPGWLSWIATALPRPLHALIAAPSLLFLAALTAMLFRPSDVQFYEIDRAAFLLLIFMLLLRACVLQQSFLVTSSLTWPLLGLILLAAADLLTQPYEVEAWSVFAAKWIVPFALFHVAGFAFADARSLRRFETFALVVLAYLSFTAIAFLLDAKELIFPRYILDEGLGIHADRARGPLLQAVANGVSLNLLALIAVDSYRRRRLRGVPALLLAIAVPLAALATKTRAVWLSFALSAVGLMFLSLGSRVRRACLVMILAGGAGLVCVLGFCDMRSLNERLQERSPVEFRMEIYQAGWEMFLEKPVAGWGRDGMQAGLTSRISDFHQDAFFFHNTYLEILVQYGLVGLALYVWLVVDLFRLSRRIPRDALPVEGEFLDQQFRKLWPLFIVVYLINGAFVVMNYQFVNGLLFTVAGMLAAQNRKSRLELLEASEL